MSTPLRGLYGACTHTPVYLGPNSAGVALPESMVFYGGRADRYVVFKLRGESSEESVTNVVAASDVVFVPPSFLCGKKDLTSTSAKVWSPDQKKYKSKARLSKEEVQSIAVLDVKESLQRAAKALVFYLLARLEKSTVHCDYCSRTFRFSVNLTREAARKSGVVTWSDRERRTFLGSQRQMGITFSTWEDDNYVNNSRAWFRDYVAWNKRCPQCNQNTVHHKCLCCKRQIVQNVNVNNKRVGCFHKPCEWQRTKSIFWKK